MKTTTFFLTSLLITMAIFTSMHSLNGTNYTRIDDLAQSIPILTPSIQKREVAKIRLSNGLEAYLVSDPLLDKSGAALSVEAGSWQDPKDKPGMAHFLEHMLFLGTEKYPEEDEYRKFIEEHGGMSNAFTTATATVYMFSINNNAFNEALDRFAQFFLSPLFNPSGVSREVNAVDQEFAKNIESEAWRARLIQNELGNPAHPQSRFAIGNKETLAKIDQQELQQWYKDHYSANLMHLVVYSPEPIDSLIDDVVKDFVSIKNYGYTPLEIAIPAHAEEREGTITYIAPLQEIKKLSLEWQLPHAFAKDIDARPASIAAFVLGHEGKESLLAELKRRNLAEALSTGEYRIKDQNSAFIIDIELTNKGLDNTDEVISYVFQAIARLKKGGIPRYLFDEIKQTALIEHQYQARDQVFATVSHDAFALISEPLTSYPIKTKIVQSYRPDMIAQFISLLTPQRAHYTLVAAPAAVNKKIDKEEQWIGAQYTVETIPKKTLDRWLALQPHPNIDIPAPNPLIPDDLTLLYQGPSNSVFPQPTLIANDEKQRVFYSPDHYYQVPQVFWTFHINTPSVQPGDPRSTVLADLYTLSLEEALNTFSYVAATAGLHYNVQRVRKGIGISIYGYSQRAGVLFEEIIKKLKTITPTETEFNIYQQQTETDYANALKESPAVQGIELVSDILRKDFVTSTDKLQTIKSIHYNEFLAFVKELFKETFTEGLLYGNISESEAKKITNTLQNTLASPAFPEGKKQEEEVILLPKGPYFIEKKIEQLGNTAILIVQDSPYSFQKRAVQSILSKGIESPFYSTLRTQQQTGYLVWSWSQEIERQLFTFFVVQSNTHAPRDLLSRFETVIEGFTENLETEFPEENFDSVKQALLTILETPPESMDEMNALLSTLAFQYDGDFNWINQRIAGMKEINYPEFLEEAKAMLGRTNRARLGILIKGKTPNGQEVEYRNLADVRHLQEMAQYTTRP
ncbi:insulinase family protein [Simkania negevensis]|uniref:Protease 3 n=1 Tax=Simkania negevensis TaxID=83561 RepID=A0ABS3ARE2_9BACT|nr:insulinase family protein [Simkania negevensis]